MWETRDTDGRRIVLTGERWSHIVANHPELDGELEAILRGLSRPALRRHGRWPE